MAPPVTVIVRARDEAPRIGRCLQLLRAQELEGGEAQLIVVDSGSRDATAEIACAHGAEVVRMPREAFSFGGALNLGAAAAGAQTAGAGAETAGAGAEILVAVSADAFVEDRQWMARLLAWFKDPAVACASGDRWGPDAGPLREPVRQDISLADRRPGWGYSNGAGAFRAELWRARRFREDLPGCEDLEWARHWLAAGYVAVIDPALCVSHDHTHDPLPRIYRRARREAEGLALFAEPAAAPAGLLGEWWSESSYHASPLRARLSPRRATRLLGQRAGRRRARRRNLRARQHRSEG